MSGLPAPSDFDHDWKNWARKLLRALGREEKELVYVLPQHPSTDLPRANQTGLLIYVTDTQKLAYTTATGWVQFP